MIHLISHSIVSHEHGGSHSYIDHAYTDDHTILQIIENGGEENEENHHTVVTPVDKVEIGYQEATLSKIVNVSSKMNVDISQVFTTIKLEIPTPPPEPIS